ncbi:putative cell wall glucanase (Utr2) [Ilyonectria robusta]
MNSLDRVADIGDYLGDPSKADWVAQGEPLIFNNNLLLTMPKDSVGTVLSSTVYMWYGNVKAKFKSSRGPGVVTAFILFSDVKDEIDYEFVGVDLETAQTNYYFQGITNYENSANISVSDTFDNFHEYEVRWTPDQIEWLIDGKVGRTTKKADTWNATSQNFEYPQTPARVQLSLWPGGLASNAKGTIDWAGGEINWDHSDIKNYGYFFATVAEVDIECYNAKTPLVPTSTRATTTTTSVAPTTPSSTATRTPSSPRSRAPAPTWTRAKRRPPRVLPDPSLPRQPPPPPPLRQRPMLVPFLVVAVTARRAMTTALMIARALTQLLVTPAPTPRAPTQAQTPNRPIPPTATPPASTRSVAAARTLPVPTVPAVAMVRAKVRVLALALWLSSLPAALCTGYSLPELSVKALCGVSGARVHARRHAALF